jgi:hypothetical protein
MVKRSEKRKWVVPVQSRSDAMDLKTGGRLKEFRFSEANFAAC